MDITIKVPDDLGEAIMAQKDPNSFLINMIKEKIKEKPVTQENRPQSGKSKWALLAQRIHEESPLCGMSDKLNELSRQFRDNF